MEKSWKDFWTSGKVEDYLTYRNRVDSSTKEQSENARQREEAEGQNGNRQYYDLDHGQSLR